jgi:DNA-binding transcriptional MerR regulator
MPLLLGALVGYYERVGVLPAPERDGGQRRYRASRDE